MKFIDEATIDIEAGDGGDGCRAFRREAHVPRGGPSGGDGGRGGSVIFKGDPQMDTLLDHSYRRRYCAKRGEHGSGRDRTGAAGKDLVIPVPVGTQIWDADEGELLADIVDPLQEVVVARGGAGGYGNARFATSTNRAPRRSDPGKPGEKRSLRLVLKLIADVGLVGLPNVGKSTLLSVVSRARPKVANYPFTTLEPNLGIADLSDGRALVIADMPGLIEGASQGRGLGIRFLKHVERTRVLLHLITMSSPDEGKDPFEQWEVIREEIKAHASSLAETPELVVLTKMDLPWVQEAYPGLKERFQKEEGVTLHAISAAANTGMQDVLEGLYEIVVLAKEEESKQFEKTGQ